MFLAMVSWGVAWTNAKIVGEYLSFYNLVFLRFFLGFISLIPFVLIERPSFISLNQIKYIIIPGILFFIYGYIRSIIHLLNYSFFIIIEFTANLE